MDALTHCEHGVSRKLWCDKCPPKRESSSYEITARWKKAVVIAAQLYVNGIVAAEVPNITRDNWEMIALRLGQNRPRYQTIEVIGEILKVLESAVAQKIVEEKEQQTA